MENEKLPLQIQQAIDEYAPVEKDGLTLWPVRVKEHELFRQARPALELLQQSLPVRLLSMPLLQALYRMDLELIASGLPPTGLFTSAVLGLVLALRLGEGQDLETRLGMVTVRSEPDDPSTLKELTMVLDGEELVRVTPRSYTKLRRIIAAQNGITLWSSEADPELVEAERVMREKNAADLVPDLRKEIMAVSILTHTDRREVLEWPLLRFTETADSVRHLLEYVICAINEGAGCTWKGGNPVPHPWFERSTGGSNGGLVELSSLDRGNAEKAVAAQMRP